MYNYVWILGERPYMYFYHSAAASKYLYYSASSSDWKAGSTLGGTSANWYKPGTTLSPAGLTRWREYGGSAWEWTDSARVRCLRP
eukprot:616907-Prymnesium_polylepis.1